MSRDNEERPLAARAVARKVPMTERKVRRVVDLVRGRRVAEALDILRFDVHAASTPVYKVIASAAANAHNNHDLDPDTLWVRTIFVDQGTTLKRIRPRAQGRAYRVRKRACHITVELESRQAPAGARGSGGRGARSAKGRTR